MAQTPDLSRYLDAGAEFVALTRAQARARAKELVGTGQLAQGQVQGFVDDLVEESRRRTDEMFDVVRREIQRQARALGFATKDDLARLEARVAAGDGAKKPAGSKAAKPKQSGTKKATGKKATAKATGRKATGKKATGKKATGKKSATKKSGGAKKSGTKQQPAAG